MDVIDALTILSLIFAFAWVAAVFVVGWAADKRGQSGLGWFVLALLTTPFVAGLLLVLLTPRRPDRHI